ncbi:hypothetical protein [Paludisphaera soli]|uniref:hypothetical protein n=1 Tax=Paludisphaera soli TaxID=2712865 RepID=UPI0013EABADC|nr:hypothetical protein [Paludisphaera soli]
MSLAVEAGRPEALVPPRPNLGPEPWRDDSPAASWPAWIALALLAACVAAWIARKRRPGGAAAPGLSAESDDSPETRLVALGVFVRKVMAARLGPALRARTTEEIAADPRLAERLDAEDLGRLVAILGAGDRVKFGRGGVAEDLLECLPEWTAWSASLDARLAARREEAIQKPSP